MRDERQTDGGLDLRRAYRVLRGRWWVVAVCMVLATGTALAVSVSKQKMYCASASLLFRDARLDQTLFGSTYFNQEDPARQAATNAKLVSLSVLSDMTARAIGGGLTGGQVHSEVQVQAEGQSNVVSITACDPSPQRAATIPNTFAQQYIAFRREADRAKVRDALRLVQTQLNQLAPAQRKSSEGRSLQQRAEQLQILSSLQTGNAELVQRASPPSSPSSPNPKRDAILALLVGLALGTGLAFLLERLDRRIKDPHDLNEIFARPILSMVPESRAIAQVEHGFDDLPTNEAEPMRMLRANLRYFNVDHEVRSVLVTSATPGEGKSTVAKHLASAAASTGERVLLLEADLRRPTLQSRMRLSGDSGLSQVLAGTRSLRSAIQQVEVAGAGGEPRFLSVLASGPIPPNPTDLIESDRMRQVLRAVSEKYDLVVIDTPPTSIVSDAIPLVKSVDGVLVVGRLGKTTRDSSVHLRDQLGNLGAYVLGVVVNSVTRAGASGYAYGYGYGYAAEYTSQKKPERKRRDRTPVVAASNGHSNGHAPERELTIEPEPPAERSVGPDYPDA